MCKGAGKWKLVNMKLFVCGNLVSDVSVWWVGDCYTRAAAGGGGVVSWQFASYRSCPCLNQPGRLPCARELQQEDQRGAVRAVSTLD